MDDAATIRNDAVKLAIHWGISSINLTNTVPTADGVLDMAKKFGDFIANGTWTKDPAPEVTSEPQASEAAA